MKPSRAYLAVWFGLLYWIFSVAGCLAPDSLLQRGNTAFQRKEWERARQYYERALEHGSTREAAAYNLGLTYFEQGEFQKSLEMFDAIPAVEVRQPMLGVYQARAAAELGLDERAEREFRSSLTVHPNLGETHLYFAYFLESRGRLSEAVEEMEVALRFNDLREQAILEAAAYRRRLNEPARAAALLEQLLTTHGDRYQHYVKLGHALLEIGEDARAEDFLRRGLGFNPGEPEGLYLLGVALQRQGKVELARELFTALDQKKQGEWGEKAALRLAELSPP
ncbi:MAG: tetratricopeptide repeat protein [Vulcanimicrobiota bacterium]